MSNLILIRYNTKHGDSDLVWRVFIDGVEHLASDLDITGTIWTKKTFENDVAKFNIACYGTAVWEDSKVVIKN
jgi:hypothetical protein